MLLPMLWMLATSFKLPAEIAVWPPHLLPQAPTLANYTRPVSRRRRSLRFFVNSVFISVVATRQRASITSLVAGAVFAKYRFPGAQLLFMLVIATAIVPFESYMIPLYIQLVRDPLDQHLSGHHPADTGHELRHLPDAPARRLGDPDELMEAARVDGASEWWIFRRVMAPLSGNALSAVGIFAFIQAWAAFIWPLLVANDQLLFNMEVGLTAFQFSFSTDYGKLMAGSVISTLPMLIIFLMLRRRIIENMALTGIKG